MNNNKDVTKQTPPDLDVVVTVGSGVNEEIMIVDDGFTLGEKHLVDLHELFGGTGFNCTVSLLEAKIPVLPILLLGDDKPGHMIQEQLKLLSRHNISNDLISQFIEDQGFLCGGLKTPRAHVVVTKNQRTIFTERSDGATNAKDFVISRAQLLEDQPGINPRGLLISHIHADNPALNHSDPGGITKSLINMFKDKCNIFLNLGPSQLTLGAGFWEKYLEYVAVFQISLGEMRGFLETNHSKPCLADMVQWLGAKCTVAIITLGSLGAVATWKGAKDSVIFVKPHIVDNIVDSTGAGDAFAAGIASVLYKQEKMESDELFSALNVATNWAAATCTGVGIMNPATTKLSKKGRRQRKLVTKQERFNPIEILSLSSARPLLERLENNYSY